MVHDDVDRALILREFRRQGFHLAQHFTDEALQDKIKKDYGGDRTKLAADLATHGETIAGYRQYTAEEIIVKVMLVRETQRPTNGRPPPSETAWLTSLRKGAHILETRPR